ncbi:UDP-glucose dehydrogenase family protein [Hippea maritima]|uniref:UDP-glucose 6-dehydrogenase n=1 Tax=Hippea maritima (strain ATCC 700847 / DSM 10411 / MH2) TaxID=760142 RepID=F2LXC1_HIPMA|nr:UDP-glucose/GDP-mannose dehydrogenase family protein [Hippea maritima]AEA34235.1 nucleotide sugar dehydrogenase [Hippea maritima DSM 10411]
MRLTMIGSGYVGLVTGACFSEMGNRVICVDIDRQKIEKLKKGIVPIFEPGLDKIIKKNLEKGNIEFTTDIAYGVKNSDIVFIAVGTPQSEDGSADLNHVLKAAESIGRYMDHEMIVVDKSTVPVGTADRVRSVIEKKLKERYGENIPFEFDVVSNPEFLKEGDAVADFMKPDRVVVGANSEKSMKIMKELYRPFTLNHERFIAMDIRSAELTKYAANAMLATKISFINEISRIAEALGADINMVRVGIGSDRRIGYHFIYPGVGYGGSCFPKDVRALEKMAVDADIEPAIIKATQKVNFSQRYYFLKKILNRFGDNLSSMTFAVWGLAFKPQTDDMREAPSITIINELTKLGATINAYDPEAMENAKNFWLKDNKHVNYFNNKYDTLNGAEAMILITEWKEFRSPDFYEIKKRLKNPIIFDGRNQYNKEFLKEFGFEYYQIGVRA